MNTKETSKLSSSLILQCDHYIASIDWLQKCATSAHLVFTAWYEWSSSRESMTGLSHKSL